MRPSQVLVAVAAFASLSSALQWPGEGAAAKAVLPMENLVFRRQGKSDSEDPPPEEDSEDGDTTSEASDDGPTATEKADPEETDDPDSGDDDKTTAKDDKDSKTTDAPDPDKTFAPNVPAGGVSIQTPALVSGGQYFKIGDMVTFGWNYTLLRATPTKIDVLVSCQSNQATYTLAANQSAEESGLVVWDTNEEATGTAPLPMASYTLIIKDADTDITATPEPGHLSAYNQFRFGMYNPQDYTDLPDFQCPTCENAGPSVTPAQSMTLLVITTSITALSFTWFARGFGVL